MIVNRLGESADAAGTVDQTGNGRLNLARALGDASTVEVQPAGAPVGARWLGRTWQPQPMSAPPPSRLVRVLARPCRPALLSPLWSALT